MLPIFWKIADECLDRFDYEGAVQVYRNALREHANNTEILDALGDTLIQMGDVHQARQALSVSIKLAPDTGASKYMNMGQILEGQDSLKHYHKGIQLLRKETERTMDEEERKTITERIVSGLGAMAEIYLTDECYADNAEIECERLLKEALQIDPENTEALQLMASFKISQQNPEEALKYLTRSKDCWIDNEIENMPSYEFRIQNAKLHLELEQWEMASEILELLLDEFDENSELWYLTGFAYSFFEPESALECLTKAKELLTKENCTEATIWQQVDTALDRVKKVLGEGTEQQKSCDVENNNLMDL